MGHNINQSHKSSIYGS